MEHPEDPKRCACGIPGEILKRALAARRKGKSESVELIKKAGSPLERRAAGVISLLDVDDDVAEKLFGDVEHPDHWLLHCREKARSIDAGSGVVPIEVGEAHFGAQILDEALPVLTTFYDGGCAPCEALDPILRELVAGLKGGLRYARIDVDKNPNLSRLYKIGALPATVLLRRGVVAVEIRGLKSLEAVRETLAPHLRPE